MRVVLILCMLLFCSTQNKTGEIFSIDEVLVNPAMFNGKLLSIKGYYVNEFENSALYVSKSESKNPKMDSENHLYKNSIWVTNFSKDAIYFDKKGNKISYYRSNAEIIMTGTFLCKYDTVGEWIFGHGHRNIWPGELKDIISTKQIN